MQWIYRIVPLISSPSNWILSSQISATWSQSPDSRIVPSVYWFYLNPYIFYYHFSSEKNNEPSYSFVILYFSYFHLTNLANFMGRPLNYSNFYLTCKSITTYFNYADNIIWSSIFILLHSLLTDYFNSIVYCISIYLQIPFMD